jgi:hypothetical protein
VFPDKGYAFVSVIWAGMVGGVTGVNENGIYLSINAAGSTDFRRLGTPSTLVWHKAMQNSKTIDDAIRIIRDETMFITDIFVVADKKSGKAFRIEKSPDAVEVIPILGPSIVANHLISERWKNDSFNAYRRDELTSLQRQRRGESILKSFSNSATQDSEYVENFALNVLRDKADLDGEPLHLGNRKAIDGLLATHSVVYNASSDVLYVSQGPGVSGAFTGFDLRASFQKKSPVAVKSLPRDPRVSDEDFYRVGRSVVEVARAQELLKHGKCDEAALKLETARSYFYESSAYYSNLGDFHNCKGSLAKAKDAWKKALALSPAYARQVRSLKEKLK